MYRTYSSKATQERLPRGTELHREKLCIVSNAVGEVNKVILCDLCASVVNKSLWFPRSSVGTRKQQPEHRLISFNFFNIFTLAFSSG